MISRRASIGFLGIFTLLLSGCVQITSPTVFIENLRLEPGEIGILSITIFNVERLQVVQVGPTGALTFDPEVIQIQSITAKNGFQIFASSIDNDNGKALFLAGFPGGSLTNGVILELEVRAVGSAADSTTVEFTQIDLMADKEGNEITKIDLRAGKVTIQPTESE